MLSHELAHLSQRHFARRVEQQQAAYLPTMAGILAGLVLAATAGGEAGVAAITATQAAALQNQLKTSMLINHILTKAKVRLIELHKLW